MSRLHLNVANASHAFTAADVEMFHRAVEAAEDFISRHFTLDYNVDIVIVTPSHRLSTIPEDGIGGQTYNSRLIIIPVDVRQEKVREDIVFEILCHEMSHSLRWEKLDEFAETMFDNMILEGLAVALEEKAMVDTRRTQQQFFLTEIQGTSQASINKMIAHLGSRFDDIKFDNDTLFFGGNDTLPRWAGYRLGYYFVKKYLNETSETLEQLTMASYSTFRSLAEEPRYYNL